MRFYKKADGGLIAIIVILIIIIILGILINIGSRECTKDSNCGKNQYCGSDFECHDHPVIEKVVAKRDLLKPALILGISLIIAAWIIRRYPLTKHIKSKSAKKSQKNIK